ncbi:MAG TPA: primosomal protein N' [Myxococcota bacterium]|nr:primosomal protein N' [Myxococcota bacterium]
MALPLFPPSDSQDAEDARLRGSSGTCIVQVALPLPLAEPLDYLVPPALAPDAEVGRRVLVPLEARRMTGVVVAVRDAPSEAARAGLRLVLRVVDHEPVISAELLSVLRELAERLLCPLGIALAAALPPGSAPSSRPTLSLTARGREALLRGAVRGPAEAFLERLARAPRSAGRGAAVRSREGQLALVRELERDGLIVRGRSEAASPLAPRTVRWIALAPGMDGGAQAAGLVRAPKQAALLRHLAESGAAPLEGLSRRFPGARALVRALAARGLLHEEERPAEAKTLHSLLEGTGKDQDEPPELTEAQAAALLPIAQAVHQRRFERFLLHGVTGSGKTEVYLRAIAEALSSGRTALVLVPEITLTHQLLARLRDRFGDALAILHSGLRARERLQQWQRLRAGATPIALGARSALFAPLENLGLIVIDEEHDSAYKNEEGFHYHARDLAAARARSAGCPVVLGSATPALESRFAAECGEITRLTLPHRIAGRPLPAVEIVDLAKERASAPRGRKLILSLPLRRALAETFADGGQAILLLNRRGFSTRIFCFECGHAERCKHCDISLVYHAAEHELRCHYCGYAIAPPEACTGCGAPDTALLGIGTERLEEEVRAQFPKARTARLDRDTARRRGTTEAVLRDLRDGAVDVVVGTQMLAKGHDFPGVRLVGVVAADLALHLPDFRAAERTFQLLTQVAGRAGRGAMPGRVLIQTFVPDHYAIRPVREHDYEGFYAEEIAHRRALGYPPCGRLAVAVVSGPAAGPTEEAAQRLAQAARAALVLSGSEAGATPGEALEVLGPAPAPLSRLRDRYRFQLLLRSASDDLLLRAARAVLRESTRLPSTVRTTVDVDPMNML